MPDTSHGFLSERCIAKRLGCDRYATGLDPTGLDPTRRDKTRLFIFDWGCVVIKDLDGAGISVQEWLAALAKAGEPPNVNYVLDGDPSQATENANKWSRIVIESMGENPVTIVTQSQAEMRSASFDTKVMEMKY